MASIRLEALQKTFPNGHVALRHLDLEVIEGEFLVLVGPSGCGKSTVLRIVAGLETPTAGRVWLDDQDATDLSPKDRDLAMVFQSYALYPHRTVAENLAFGLRMRGVPRETIQTRVLEVAKSLELDELLERRPSQLSGGQRQRVALGRAIVRDARAFLLDEPLSNLDAKLRVETRAELLRMHRRLEATFLYVTHDQEEAMTLGDRIAVLREGTIEQVAAPLEVYQRPATRFVAGFIGSPAMNFLHATLSAGDPPRRLEGRNFSVELPEAPPGIAPGARVDLGVRPQDVEIVAESAADARATVEVMQTLGHGLLIHSTLGNDAGGERITALAGPDATVALDQKVGLRFRTDRLHLFDSDDGRRIG